MPDNLRITLQSALTRLNAEKSGVDRQISALETALGALAGRSEQTGRRRRKMSVSARKAIGARMKAYWAKRRAGNKGVKK